MARNKQLVASMNESNKSKYQKPSMNESNKGAKKMKKSTRAFTPGRNFDLSSLKRLTYAAKMRRCDRPMLHMLNKLVEQEMKTQTERAVKCMKPNTQKLQIDHLRKVLPVRMIGF
jgi:hypothetical protein